MATAVRYVSASLRRRFVLRAFRRKRATAPWIASTASAVLPLIVPLLSASIRTQSGSSGPHTGLRRSRPPCLPFASRPERPRPRRPRRPRRYRSYRWSGPRSAPRPGPAGPPTGSFDRRLARDSRTSPSRFLRSLATFKSQRHIGHHYKCIGWVPAFTQLCAQKRPEHHERHRFACPR